MIKRKEYTLEERIAFYKLKVGDKRINLVFMNSAEAYQHLFLDRNRIPRTNYDHLKLVINI